MRIYTKSEKRIERNHLCEGVKKKKGICLKLWPWGFTGIPDRLVLFPGARIFFVETKSTDDTPKKIQGVVHKKLRKLGFTVLVLDTVEKVKAFLNEN